MKKFLIATILLFSLLPSMNIQAATLQTQSTWIWNPWSLYKEETKIIQFLQNNNVQNVYLQIDADIPNSIYQQFITNARKSNIEVHALDGSADWIYTNENNKMGTFFKWLTNYQNSSNVDQRFSGVHLDVEPYLLSGWSTDLNNTVLAYQETIKTSVAKSKKLGLPIGLDMPFWFNTITFNNKFGTSNLAKWAINQANYTTIMAYRNTATGANGINVLVKEEVQYAKNAKKPIQIAVETGESAEGANISFYGKSLSYMNQELNKVRNHYVNDDVSISIHYIETWMSLK
ncbi:amidase [Bacillus sp. B1-b2]|uniref:amidase n=1 Tax=Bacillus sp. B1-b2 TaxID=2653201 RepID=UPI001261C453|nr:amidase [Bacillus sp. B1-b2]KAB7671202.1 amidase [Bacillus sp. B1-b2]